MAKPTDDPSRELQRSLQTLSEALSKGSSVPSSTLPPELAKEDGSPALRTTGRGAIGLSAVLLVTAIATGHSALILPALALGITAGLVLFTRAGQRLSARLASRDPTRAYIGMGATVRAGARVEPGATIEMGADIGAGAVIKRGAVVRMGAAVRAGAVIEEGAVVSWGADVRDGAVVGPHAVVGAGASVGKNARVPARTRILPGSTWGASSPAPMEGTPAPLAPAANPDPREQRIDALCDRLEAELVKAPPHLRQYLGASAGVVRSLRETCHGLLRRELAARAEASPTMLSALAQERVALERRIASGTDPAVRRPLEAALAAIDDQQRQREWLGRTAERLDAELTRLLWTLDGMCAQLVRLRSAGVEVAAAPDAEIVRSMKQLHDEIDAIAGALEEVARDDREVRAHAETGSAPVDDAAGDAAAEQDPRKRERA